MFLVLTRFVIANVIAKFIFVEAKITTYRRVRKTNCTLIARSNSNCAYQKTIVLRGRNEIIFKRVHGKRVIIYIYVHK